MEKEIKSFTELKAGDLVLIQSPMSRITGIPKDDLAVVTTIIPTHKYPIGDSTGRKLFYRDRKAVYADEQGDTGDEMVMEYGITSSDAGEYTFREDDEPIWNIRLIDETHPRYDAGLARQGRMSGGVFDMLSKFFN